MQVLVLGGHGKVARYLTPLLLDRAWNVTSVVRNPKHEDDIMSLGKGRKGKVNVLVSSLDQVKSASDARKILDTVSPDYVVWSAGAGGKGGPASTIAVDQEAAKHFLSASFASAYVSKFLMVSYLGCRRNKPIWMSDDDWAALMHVKTEALPTYVKAKLEADEYMTALVAKRKTDTSAHPLQAINLRPGFLIDAPATRKVQLGRTAGRGSVTREDVAIVADQLLVSADAEGWIDLINGDVPVEVAVQKVGKEKNDRRMMLLRERMLRAWLGGFSLSLKWATI